MKRCDICEYNYAQDTHHLIFGRQYRKLCDQDKIVLEICRDCHNEIHNTKMGTKLSKMFGQQMWEAKYMDEHRCGLEEARSKFRERYCRSWL